MEEDFRLILKDNSLTINLGFAEEIRNKKQDLLNLIIINHENMLSQTICVFIY